jgi:predicted transglutaminase-like cysteine proteinase
MQADALTVARCRSERETCSSAALQFVAIVDEARQQKGLARIGHVNRAINLAITAERVSAPLVWRSPLAVLAEGRSDCNGFAIVKYAALDAIGAAEHRLVIVHINPTGDDHMVAVVRDGARWLILDNNTMVLADSGESTYVPLLEFKQDGVRLFVSPNPNVAGRPCMDAIAVAQQ